MRFKLNWDMIGIATSLACAIHCALLPLLLTSLPLFGKDIIHDPVFEWGMIAVAFMIGVFALFHGYVKHHRNGMPVVLFAAGFCFLALKQFFHDNGIILLIPAVSLIVAAHYLNYRMCHRSRCSSPHHQH